jgi:hypothetical protein
MWAVLGYAMGMEDEYNIAIQPSLAATKKYYNEMYRQYLMPSLFDLRDDGKTLTEAFYRVKNEIYESISQN